jgi:segregation and condensation protein A
MDNPGKRMDSPDSTLEDITPQGLSVKLELFEGPLDLLLHLIRENKVDITDIPIAEITEQYLGYLELMKTLDLDVAGEFLLMAATLMHIKSRLLLPVEEEGEGLEEGEDPREELVRQLQEYQQFKEAGMTLQEFEEDRSRVFLRQSIGPEPPRRTDYPLEVSLFELLSALKKLVESMPEEKRVEIERDQLSVSERISDVLEYLRGSEGEVPFEDLFKRSTVLAELVVTFLALLELVRLRMVRAWQAVPGGRIMVVDIRPDDDETEGDGPPGLEEQEETGEETFQPPERREEDSEGPEGSGDDQTPAPDRQEETDGA